MDSVLVAFRRPPDLRPVDVPTLRPVASDPPGFERDDGSRVYVNDAAAYLRDMRSDADGTTALEAGLSLLPGDEPAIYREVLHSRGTAALTDLLAAWGRLGPIVVWDSQDRPRTLPEFLATL